MKKTFFEISNNSEPFHKRKNYYYQTRKTALKIRRKKGVEITGKEADPETGLYYYGARYLDPRTSRWMSGDPAVGDYIPSAPVDDEARKRNSGLPGMGGVYNLVNLHVYHYAGNNPVKYVDPDGEFTITAKTTKDEYDKMIGQDIFPIENDEFWGTMQNYFSQNPNGAYYRHDDESRGSFYKDADDINVIDPERANAELLGIFVGGKALSLLAKGFAGVKAAGIGAEVSRTALVKTAELFKLGIAGQANKIIPTAEKIAESLEGRKLLGQMNNLISRMLPYINDEKAATVLMSIQDVTRIFGEYP
jgi:RHS repeat-associated protein